MKMRKCGKGFFMLEMIAAVLMLAAFCVLVAGGMMPLQAHHRRAERAIDEQLVRHQELVNNISLGTAP
jgi:hypothetical protein